MPTKNIYLFVAYVLVLVMSTTTFSKAQEKLFEIDTNYSEKKDFDNYLFLLEDKNSSYTIEEVIQQEKNFLERQQIKQLNKDNVYWGKISIKNTLPSNEWILRVGRGNSKVEVYIQNPQGKIKKVLTGRYVRFSKKSIPEPKNDDVFLRLAQNDIYTLYIRAETTDQRKPNFKLKFFSTQEYYQASRDRNLLQGIFQGLVWVMLLYNLLIFITSKDKTYLYYSIYLFSISLYTLYFQGYLIEYFIPENPEWESYVWLFSININSALYFLFTISFLESKNRFPRLHKILVAVTIFRITMAFILMIWWHFTWDFQTINQVTIYNSFAEAIIITILYISLLIKQDVIIRYFIVGSVSLNLGAIIGILFYGYSLDVFAVIYEIGVLGEILSFSLGLGYKIQLTERATRTAQDKLILQLKENQSFREKVNAELEQKVIERTQEIQEQKERIEEQNNEITSSINYAQRIQDAILPNIDDIQKYFPESFVLFRPRDIVSGDFYWFASTESKAIYEEKHNFHTSEKIFKGFDSEKIIIAAVDCTGHGVPGAFMSMVGDGLLKQIVHEHEVHQPHKILQEVDTGISLALKREEANNQDGMDGAICTIDLENRLLHFSGARNPLIYIQNNELYKVTSARKSLGGISSRDFEGFKQTSISLDTPSTFYIFSDGFQDQFGGKNKRKFNRNNFYKLLLEIHQEPFLKQKEILNQKLENWMQAGEEEQIDDILVIGFKIS